MVEVDREGASKGGSEVAAAAMVEGQVAVVEMEEAKEEESKEAKMEGVKQLRVARTVVVERGEAAAEMEVGTTVEVGLAAVR